jgi:hypothetical protein
MGLGPAATAAAGAEDSRNTSGLEVTKDVLLPSKKLMLRYTRVALNWKLAVLL